MWAYRNDVPILNPEMGDILTYLRLYFESGVGYGAINTARCALSLVLPRDDGHTVGEHFLIKRFCKACHEQRPPQPRYQRFWSVHKVLNWIANLGMNSELSLKLLAYKVTLLLLLVSSQRGQTILNLHVDRITWFENTVTFRMKKLLKHNQLGQPLDALTLYAYPDNKNLCVLRTLKAYLKRTKELRKKQTQLLISYIAPNAPISRATLARWTLEALKLGGIDTDRFKSHSTRGASASAAKAMGMSLNAVLRNASWKDAKSFARFYHKTIENPGAVQRAILDTANVG